MKKSLLKLKNVSKFYYNKGTVASGFSKINLEFNLGEFVVITGESGSGKSTLLNVLSGLDTYEEGEMYINGTETSHYSREDIEKYRKNYIGNIFQAFNLVNSYTVYQNIELVLLLNGYQKNEIKTKILELIAKVDLTKFKNTKVSKLSGGQKQRVAIARALAKDTPIIIADEPTGNLDSKSATSIIKLLAEVAKEKLVIIVTHNYDQVESYATRKIKMHDGRVIEDINLKEVNESDPKITNYENITFLNKLLLGIRNTFNIIPKFILMFIVFLFITIAFLSEYGAFKGLEYDETKSADNYFFSNLDDTRLILNKKDKTAFSKDEINKITKLENVNNVVVNDVILDQSFQLNDPDYYYYFSGNIKNFQEIDHVDVGRLPQSNDEVVVQGYKGDYNLSDDFEGVTSKEYNLLNNEGYNIDTPNKLKIVGIIYNKSYNDQNVFYVSDEILNLCNISINNTYSKEYITINNNEHKTDAYNNFLKIKPSTKVSKGNVAFSENYNYLCQNSYCLNKELSVRISNIYYEESLKLTITSLYNKNNFKDKTGYNYNNFEDVDGEIFISYEDYDYLFNKDSYQISVFAKDVKEISKLKENLKDYNILTIKDSKVSYDSSLLAAIKIIKLVVLIGLFIVLFFISYFVIKLIQKSKNIYYSTIRILGGSKNTINSLIRIELLNIANLAYLVVIALVILIEKQVININYLKNITANLEIKEYILIYVITMLMSLLIASRYSRKMFKTSAMNVYREEV